jgi:hypothetical protein
LDFFRFSEYTYPKKLADIKIKVHQNPYLIQINILLREISFNHEKKTEITIKIINAIQIFFQRFRYGLNFLYQKIRAINKSNNHTHSRIIAGSEGLHK